jgi:cytochrome c556
MNWKPMNWKKATGLLVGLATTAALVGTSLAGLPDDRESTMKDIGKNFKALVQMSKGEFKAEDAAKHGNAIAADLEKFKDLFPEGSEKADKVAKPEIWTDRAGFEQARMNAYNAAIAVSKVADAAAFGDAFKALGGTCKACHDKYRAEEN